MAAVEEELDFSSYLVDIDDDGGLDSATSTTNAAFASSSYLNPASLPSSSAASTSAFSPSSAGRPFQPLQTHSAKNWPAGIIQQHQHIAPISPSPPESASDSSYRASTNSTAGTAPSSIASTSYPDSGSSWGTQKTFVNPKKSQASTPSTSLSSSANTSLNRTSALSSSRKSATPTTSTDNTPPASSSAGNANHLQQPSLSLSFNYDFAHNPALGTALSPPVASPQQQQQQPSAASSYTDTFDPAQYSASLPSSSSRSNGFSSRRGSSDRLSSMDSHSNPLGKPMSPSSGPQHVSKGHRSRQQSASSSSLSTSLGSGGPSPHWLSMTPSTPSIAVPQFASTPYSRPVLTSNDSNNQLGTGSASQQASGTSTSLSKRPSKRKNTSNVSSTSAQQVQAESSYMQQQQSQQAFQQPQQQRTQQHQQPIQQFPLNTTSNLLNTSAPGVQQFGFPIPGPSYRDPVSGITSPISPSLDSFPVFANFMPQTASSSTVASPTSQQANIFSTNTSKSNSNASTPNDAILSAVTAPSPFDPKNFGSLNFDPLSDDFNAQFANFGAPSVSQSPSYTSQTALEVNKAAALAGVGGTWLNWTNSQSGNQETDAALISNVLAKAPEVANASSPSSTTRASATASKNVATASAKSPPAFDPFPTRESSVHPSAFGDIEGESPEDLAARDPLATHLWRLYAKAKAGLPNGARMENITWRMMGLKLNKQKADAASAGTTTSPATAADAATTVIQKERVAEEPEERGRRGRNTAANSASPGESGDFAEMDWRQQSRSRSRVPQAIAGGMDWRAQSRSRSRAPGMRLSMPSGPQGFHLPTYADIVETMASVSRAPQDVSTGTNANPSQNVESSGQVSGHHSRQASQNQLDLQSFERTLKQYIADGEAASRGIQTSSAKGTTTDAGAQSQAESSTLPYSYVPPAPLPISPTAWVHGIPSEQEFPASLPSSVPNFSQITLQQPSQAQSIPNVSQIPGSENSAANSAENALLQSQKSISASVEAYLSSLEHTTSVIDLPPHRHVGSIPGLFNEQELKANQHADYGFLPKLVRKTSFDASYPAQLAHEQQKQTQKKKGPAQPQQQQVQQQPQQVPTMPAPQAQQFLQDQQQAIPQGWADPNNLFLMDNINGYLRGVAQSVPSTPSVATANMAYNFLANSQTSGQMTPFTPYNGASPDANQQAQLAHAHAQAQAQTAAVEAFRRLQTAQALQAAAQQQQQQHQQQQQTFTPYLMESTFSPGSLPPELLAAMSPGQYGNVGMHINPSQTQHMQYPSNVFPNYGDMAASTWPTSPQSSQTSPAGHYPSPEDYAAAAEEERLRSAATSRSSSLTNIPSLLSQSFTPSEYPQDANSQSAESKKTHSRQQSTVTSANGTNDSSGAPTVCVNCKTTNTPLWRRDEHGQPLCNACQLFRKLHGSDRPVSLHNSVVKKRNRTRNKEAPKKSTSRSQRRNSVTMPAKDPEDTTPEDN